MNETNSDKQKTPPQAAPVPPKPAPKAVDNLARIAVHHLYFAENVDLPGGTNQVSNVPCRAVPPTNPRFFECDFLPGWQMFELRFTPGAKVEPITQLIPAMHVRRWERA